MISSQILQKQWDHLYELIENIAVCLKAILVDFDLLVKGPSINLNRYPILILVQQQEDKIEELQKSEAFDYVY